MTKLQNFDHKNAVTGNKKYRQRQIYVFRCTTTYMNFIDPDIKNAKNIGTVLPLS